MKKMFCLFIVCVFCLAFTSASFADEEDYAVAKVFVTVDPNVAVAYEGSVVDLGGVQSDDFDANITFRVDANMEDVMLYALATDLYKGNVYLAEPEVDPILLNTRAGVTISPEMASPMAGASDTADPAAPNGETINGWPAVKFLPIHFESGQNGHFSQNVNLRLTWTQDDEEKPQGEYSGWVQLYCFMPGLSGV